MQDFLIKVIFKGKFVPEEASKSFEEKYKKVSDTLESSRTYIQNKVDEQSNILKSHNLMSSSTNLPPEEKYCWEKSRKETLFGEDKS